MVTIRPMSNGKGYSADYLESFDYYSETHRASGVWFGKGAEKLGLGGEVKPEDYDAVREGLHPQTGDKLRPRVSADRLDKNGEVRTHGRELYDITISAPKSISVMACIGGDERLLELHERASKIVMEEAERCAQTRVRTSGQSTDRLTGNFVSASYRHHESRDLDPNVHTHNATLNVTFDHTEERWKALQMSGIFQRTSYLTEVYRNEMARGLEELGYETEYRWDSKHSERVVEIKAISPELCRKFSRMSQRRDDAIATFMEKHGRMPTHDEETTLIRQIRPKKDKSLTPDEVHDMQLSRCSTDDLAMISDAWRNSYSRLRAAPEPGIEASINHAFEHIFERVSVARDFEVLEEALRHSRGRASLDQMKDHLRKLERQGKVFTHDGEIATEQSLDREKAMIGMVDQGKGRYEPLNRYREFQPSEKLSSQQREAVDYILNSRDLAVNLCGAPGTGKTFTLQEIKRGLELAERPTLAVAPTKSAEEELRRVGFGNAMTIEGLLQDKDAPLRMFNTVLMVDEAGMVGARQMSELLSLAAKCGSRVVFSGDTRQINSVEAGDSLRILEKESKLGTVEMTEPRRQKNAEYGEAVKTLRANPYEGYDRLEAQGAIKEVSDDDRPAAVAKARREAKGETIIVCPTHAEIDAVTKAIRADRHVHGELGEERTFTRLEPLNWTLAERTDFRNYEPGMRLVFHRPTKNVERHESLEIVSVKDNAVLVKSQNGTETEVTQKQAKSFGVFAAREIQVAPGDLLMLKQNRRGELHATNGDIAPVKQFDAEGRIELEDGRVLTEDYQCFTYGYAATAHKAQAKTVDNTIVSANGMSREQFLVAVSRGRESVQVFTSDAEELRDSVVVSGARQSATELAARAVEAGLENARKEVWWTDFETGAPTLDGSRAQPQPGQSQSRVQQERHRDRASERGFGL